MNKIHAIKKRLFVGLFMGFFISLSSIHAHGATEATRLQNTLSEISSPMINASHILTSANLHPIEWHDFMINRLFPFIESMYYDGIMMAQDLATTDQHAQNVQLLKDIIEQYKKIVTLITDSLLLAKKTETKKTEIDNLETNNTESDNAKNALKQTINPLKEILLKQMSKRPENGNTWAQELLEQSIFMVDSIGQKIIVDYEELNPTKEPNSTEKLNPTEKSDTTEKLNQTEESNPAH